TVSKVIRGVIDPGLLASSVSWQVDCYYAVVGKRINAAAPKVAIACPSMDKHQCIFSVTNSLITHSHAIEVGKLPFRRLHDHHPAQRGSFLLWSRVAFASAHTLGTSEAWALC